MTRSGEIFLSFSTAFLLIAALNNPIAEAKIGPGGTGGGNWQEANFADIGRSLYRALSTSPIRAERLLNIHLVDYLNALNGTDVQCAMGSELRVLKSLNKISYFTTEKNTIFLDCQRYDELRQIGSAKYTVVFHEYMRKIGKEGSSYEVSSKLLSTLRSIHADVPDEDETDSSADSGEEDQSLTIAVQPENGAIINTPGESCTDLVWKSKDPKYGNLHSVRGPRLSFGNFLLEWRRPDEFDINQIRVTVNGGPNHDLVIFLDPSEIEALIGKRGGVLPANGDLNPGRYTVYYRLQSNSSPDKLGFEPCGLSIGPIKLPLQPKGFRVGVRIDLFGFSVDHSKNKKRTFHQTFNTKADFFG